ncbi:MAG: hypothetical protein ABI091_02380 [Ferruginibacter sp.]
MKTLFLFLFSYVACSVGNKIFAQDSYSLSTVKMSFSYTKKTTGKGSTTLTITGNNSNAPMLQGLNGSVVVSSKNKPLAGQSSGQTGQSNPTTQMPAGGASAFGSATYNKFFTQVNQDHSLNGTMSYTSTGDRLKGVPDINFIFNYDPGNKMGNIGIGASSISVHTISSEDGIKTIDGTIGGGVGATTDITKSMYGYSGMKTDPNAAYIQLSKTKTGYRISYYKETKGEGGATTTEDMIAFIGEPDGIYEAAITPYNCDYANWLPTGPTVDGKGDRRGDVTLKFVPDVYLQGHPDYKYPGKLTTNWRLGNVTKYPGICNNYPEYTQSPDVTADLIFNPDMKQNTVFTSVTNTDAATISCFSTDAPVNVICKDYAAWGKLSAVITLDNGTTINAISSSEPGKQYLTIPLDKDENKLADAWEATYNTDKHPLTWDEDAQPTEQRGNGDGYTLFEEYRGFAIHINANTENQTAEREDFVRTDPNKKDAFIYDPEKLFQTYYEPQNASKLDWHYISPNQHQMYYDDNDIRRPLNRWVNFNKVSDYFYSEQYALVIKTSANVYKYDSLATGISFTSSEWQYALDKNDGRVSSNAVMDELTKENNGTKDVYKNPTKTLIRIDIILPAIAQKCALVKQQSGEAAYKSAFEVNIGNTVRHEIGHCIGIRHHKPTADSGPEACVMRYMSNAQRNNAISLNVVHLDYCRKGETGPDYIHTPRTGATPPGEEDYTEQPAGTSSSDNCYGQISVKSKPGE